VAQQAFDREATLKLIEKQRNRQWFNDNYESLKNQYNEKYIAIRNERVIDSDPDFEVLLNRLNQTFPRDDTSIIIEQITEHKPILIL
jgi:hypothetical protein